jgi:phospholipid/cholesterol/gamma-HCH transport system substrate-binding protein
MATGTNHWKIGLFVLMGGATLVGLLLVIGARSWTTKTLAYTTYFDESVQGLEIGAPVKFRGVLIGAVKDVHVAPDGRLVGVDMHLEAEAASDLLTTGRLEKGGELRTQLAQMGLTGHRFVLIDVFESERYPALPLPFEPPERYLPSFPSTMSQLEQSVVDVTDQIPEVAERANQALAQLQATLVSIDEAQVPQKLARLLDDLSKTVATINTQVTAAKLPDTTQELRGTLAAVTKVAQRADGVVERIGAKDGVLTSAEGSLTSMRHVARGVEALTPEMDAALKEVRAAARSFRRLADSLEREPDMLIKGRKVSMP